MNSEEVMDLFERTPDLVCIVNKKGWFLKVNQAVVQTLGYTEQELFAQPVSAFIYPDDKEMTGLKRTSLLDGGPLLNFQNRYVSKSEEIVWLEWTSVYFPEKEIVFAIAKNITRRKHLEMEIEENYRKYEGLARHFKNHIEKDRKYFAAELHEELAQLTTVIKMDMEWLHANKREPDEILQPRWNHALSTLQLLIDKTRKLSYAISPAMIEDTGLNGVLKWLCHEFALVTGIRCSYESSVAEDLLNYEVKLDFYRICQEALMNVMHHSEASQVKIGLEKKKDRIQLSVADNGIGFDHKSEEQKSGLKSMQGRASLINAKLFIKSREKKGTKVVVSLPL